MDGLKQKKTHYYQFENARMFEILLFLNKVFVLSVLQTCIGSLINCVFLHWLYFTLSKIRNIFENFWDVARSFSGRDINILKFTGRSKLPGGRGKDPLLFLKVERKYPFFGKILWLWVSWDLMLGFDWWNWFNVGI